MFIRNCWYVAGWDDQLPDDGMLSLSIINEPVVIYRKSDGNLVALEDRCVHRHAPLSMGKREGDDIRCLYHGLKFDPSGRCVDIPGQSMIPPKACVRSYPVIQRNGWIWIWMGDKDRADEALMPDTSQATSGNWFLPRNYLDYPTHYMLICDNLTDFSHLGYVHTESFGTDPTWGETSPTIIPLDRGIRMQRWIRDVPPVPPLGEAAKHKRVDHWATYDFLVPGILIFYNALYPVGTAEAVGDQPPTEALGSPLYTHFSVQAVTPKTDDETRYFYAWGPSTSLGNEEEAAIMREVLKKAFLEDKDIIEAQQRVKSLDSSRKVMPIAADKGVILFQRVVENIIKLENSQGLRLKEVH